MPPVSAPRRRSAETLSIARARRVALAAQGFGSPPRAAPPTARAVADLAVRLGAVQIDSVSAVVRSHYLPAFSRLGPYDRAHLDTAAYRRRGRRMFEYWGHEASFLPVELWPLMRWRMEQFAASAVPADPDASIVGKRAHIAATRPEFVEAVLAEVAASKGGLTPGELSDPGVGKGPWWGWADGKTALEFLFATGRVSVVERRSFARVYDLAERVIPPEWYAAPVPSPVDAQKQLLVRSARAIGVGTAADLADHYRLHVPTARRLVPELAEEGLLVPVSVQGWNDVAYLDPMARMPRRVDAQALLSPFDSLIWGRPRTERLFDFRFRLELYTPEPARVHGYYVLPLLVGERIAARFDLRADRAAGVLRVPGAFAEPDEDLGAVAEVAATEIRRLADWLGLGDVLVGERGDLAPALIAARP
jgi:uncharacterized protein